ncbi:MAG: DUF2075 domain-containing protein [Chitinophagales bacterium]|nr:DUF2075 domain-containing protein [Chitinophagales bacterium]
MSISFDLAVEISEEYDFSISGLAKIEQNPWVKNQWPLVYFIQNRGEKIAYVGESTNASSRFKNHLSNPQRLKLNKVSIISSDKFNKSATLDLESSLIQYLTAEGTYKLQNGNHGLINHNYYQQDLYQSLFKEVWKKLLQKRVVSKTLAEIENSELFKYSPYKTLNEDQYNSALEILKGLTKRDTNQIFISGSAGTGKTILASYLIKLLSSDPEENNDDTNEKELLELNYVKLFRKKYPKARIALVIAMSSLRTTLQNVFSNIPGLKASMVISPAETFKQKEKYDLLIVDEAHRLRQYKNISWRGAFKNNNKKLGLGDNGTELDWILANSKNQIFFYDKTQSVKPSDVNEKDFMKLLSNHKSLKIQLTSQMRVKGDDSNNYISFVDDLLHTRAKTNIFSPRGYDLYVFDSFKEMHAKLSEKENEYGLCRMIAGYAWEWLSDPKRKPKPTPDVTDFDFDGLKFKWNSTNIDWVNSANAFNEIGCIHTTQGYDLNYAGIIFGSEIDYDPLLNKIVIDPKKYFDKYGKIGANEDELKKYIINVYKTIMYRGIRGTYIYACNTNMSSYLKRHIQSYKPALSFRILPFDKVKPFVNAVPLIDIKVAAGQFSELQKQEEIKWIELPKNITAKKEYFVCQVLGESMNKLIPNGSFCLFKKYEGGSREGKIVLVEATNIHDADFGSGYTVKEYHSKKSVSEDGWKHETITLKPLSTSENYTDIYLNEDDLLNFRVLGIFERILD